MSPALWRRSFGKFLSLAAFFFSLSRWKTSRARGRTCIFSFLCFGHVAAKAGSRQGALCSFCAVHFVLNTLPPFCSLHPCKFMSKETICSVGRLVTKHCTASCDWNGQLNARLATECPCVLEEAVMALRRNSASAFRLHTCPLLFAHKWRHLANAFLIALSAEAGCVSSAAALPRASARSQYRCCSESDTPLPDCAVARRACADCAVSRAERDRHAVGHRWHASLRGRSVEKVHQRRGSP